MAKRQFASPAERIIVALDVDELNYARKIIRSTVDLGVTFKIGNQLGTYEGWKAVTALAKEFNTQVFYDTKFKDIPETVNKSCRAISRHQPDFFTVMADTNLAALRAAVEGVESARIDYNLTKRPAILGVTVLTSLSNDETRSIYGAEPAVKVLQFSRQAAQAGFDGVVCSAQEAKALRSDDTTKHLLLVTPGIRPLWAYTNDQSRAVTPTEAIANGADYIVIGRPITQPPPAVGTPRDALLKIIEELVE